LNGERPDPSHVISFNGNGSAVAAMERFCSLWEEIGAIGSAYVCYMREAYVSPESNRLRVTFGRHLRGSACGGQISLSPPAQGVPADVGGVVLEIKFTDRFPAWRGDMVRAFDLERCSMGFPNAVGEVEAVRIDVAAGTDGTLMPVAHGRWVLFDRVEANQVLARLNDRPVQAEMTTLAAELAT
jgi:hypothetical protein